MFNYITSLLDDGNIFRNYIEDIPIFNNDITAEQREIIEKNALYAYYNIPIVKSSIDLIIEFSIQNGFKYDCSNLHFNKKIINFFNKKINNYLNSINNTDDSYICKKILLSLILKGYVYVGIKDNAIIYNYSPRTVNEYSFFDDGNMYLKEEIVKISLTPEITPISTCNEYIFMLKKIIESELKNNLVNSLFSVFILKDNPSPINFITNPNSSKFPKRLEPGAIYQLNNGERVETINARNTDSFLKVVEQISKHITASIGCPYEIAVMSFSSSFSASKANFFVFKKTCEKYQHFLLDFIKCYIYNKIKNKFNKQIAKIFINGKFFAPEIGNISEIEEAKIEKIYSEIKE